MRFKTKNAEYAEDAEDTKTILRAILSTHETIPPLPLRDAAEDCRVKMTLRATEPVFQVLERF